MTQKTGTAAQKAGGKAPQEPWGARPVLTTQQRLEAIEQMLERVSGYVEFMRGVDALKGSSAEAKEAAVVAFYERMVVLERQLGGIAEGLRLG
jgi:hypothetical protein